MSRRRVGVFALVAVFATCAGVACSSFTEEPDGTAAQDAAVADGSSSATDAPSDTSVIADGGTSCDDFDAAPLPTQRMVSCNGTMTDLFADPVNCGWCDHSCRGEECDGMGRCLPEAVLDLGSGHQPLVDAIDGQFLYFRDGMDVVLEAPLADLLQQTTLAAKNDAASTAQFEQIVAGDRLYVRQYGQLGYVDPVASQVTSLTEIGAGGLAAALSTGVVVTEQQSPTDGRVRIYARDGAPIQTLNGQPGAHDLAVTPDHQRSFWIARGAASESPPMAMLSEYAGQLVPLGAVTLDTFAPNALAADDTTLYLVGPGASVSVQPVTATQAVFATQLTPGLAGRRTAAIAAADGRLYWFASDGAPRYYEADLYSVSRCGGPVVKHLVAADETNQIGGLQVDADYIYWAKGSQIWRVAK